MPEDKRIKELLLNSIEEPSSNFTDKVMEKIELISNDNKQKIYLLHHNFLRILAAAFVIIAMLLLGINMYVDKTDFIIRFKLPLTEIYIVQIIQFLLAFWIVMLGNYFIQRHKKRLIN